MTARGAPSPACVELRDEEIEVAAARGGHERDAAAVRRIPRLKLHGLRLRELLRLAARQIESPELDRIGVMSREHDEASVGRPVGLIVVARAVGQLVGACRRRSPAATANRAMLYTTRCPSGENATLDGPLVSCGRNISR